MQAATLGLSVPEPTFDTPYFSLADTSLSIDRTDTVHDMRPRNRIEVADKGRKKYYKRMPLDSSASKHWRRKIGNELVHKFLLKDPDGQKESTLTNFPDGYYLYSHNSTTKKNLLDIEKDRPDRQDEYLFGGGKKFRSPNESLHHFAWIMHGMKPNRCQCTYCTPDKSKRRKQGAINVELDAAWRKFLNDRKKKEYQDWQQRQRTKEPYVAPEPTVNVYNEEMFLGPSS